MHHLDEMPGAVRPAMEIPMFGLARLARGALGTGRGFDARRKRSEDRIEMRHDRCFAADHMAVSTLKSPYTPADANIDIVETLGLQRRSTANVILVVGVAAVDDDVATLQ